MAALAGLIKTGAGPAEVVGGVVGSVANGATPRAPRADDSMKDLAIRVRLEALIQAIRPLE